MKLVHIGDATGEYEALVLIDDDTPPEDHLMNGARGIVDEVISVTEIDDDDLPHTLPTNYLMVKKNL